MREAKDIKKSYISSISAKFNPDLLIGQAFVEDDLENPQNLDFSSLQLLIKKS